jgi:hypothetical protein
MTHKHQTTEPIFKSELVGEMADKLKEVGLKIYYSLWSSQPGKPSYFYFTDGENIGYCQEGYFGGLRFSSVHKPCREAGTGFGLQDDPGLYTATVEDAKKAFTVAPAWWRGKRIAIKKYKDWNEYTEKNNSCKYVEY